ncbi:unannotated protein [freshwater metagenome]|uniref:Unannotated protein n=1 Tax=freshwater metagenome TaxID=449393 RepID=A0A6J6W3K3_9ZZZZ
MINSPLRAATGLPLIDIVMALGSTGVSTGAAFSMLGSVVVMTQLQRR